MKKLLSIILAVIICMSCVGCGKSSNEKQVYTAAEKAIEAFDAYYFDMEISSEEAIKKIEDYSARIDEAIDSMDALDSPESLLISSTILGLSLGIKYDGMDALEARNELAELVGKRTRE